MSTERLSEQTTRQNLVNQLKELLLCQSEECLTRTLNILTHTDAESARPFIETAHNLYRLIDYVHAPDSFMRWNFQDSARDVVIYRIEKDTLEYMLQDENVLSRILTAMSRPGCSALGSRFFEFELYTMWERMQ